MYGTDHGNHVDVTGFVDSDYAKDPDKGREVLKAKTVKVLKVGTEHNDADALTKVVPRLELQHCLELLNTAFLSGSEILDGVLIANEIVNVALKSKLELLLFKVDFEKDFDSVSWDFLIDVMKQMGFGHRCMNIPFCYLGLPVEKNMRNKESWLEVVDRINSRLSSWKSRLLLIGFDDETNGISWVNWDSVFQSNESRGLGIGSLRAINLGLLGKWWWRFLNEKNALWCKVISVFYGVDSSFSSRISSGLHKGIWENVISYGVAIDTICNTFKNVCRSGILSGGVTS
nr:RNA-directed DNA polymerase, eukaryota, reverse transcriptase zinc-binding domain protein [Tanacetum cinerariifolium]